MFLIRDARASDLPGLHAAARHLNSVNLPDDPKHLSALLERSERSFLGQIDAAQREFLFVLEEHAGGGAPTRIVGTSMIIAQHGSRRSPHVYFDVLDEERYSETLDKHVSHRLLRIGYNYNGPTEIGGLVLLPELRGHAERLGLQLSYVRFLYMALHRAVFRDEVISELMPPLEADGTSLLWESLGRNFTGLTYQEADRLSSDNKEFIRALFPQTPLYVCLLPRPVQALIGQVGPATLGVEKMLRAIGFRFASRIDPFDGGPHFHVRTDDITLLRASRRATVSEGEGGPRFCLVSRASGTAPTFRAVRVGVRLDEDRVSLPAAARETLGVRLGDEVGLLPL